MYETNTDKSLLEMVVQSDEAAYRELFRRHYRSICMNAHKVYPDQHKAKDFAQEVFLDLWKRRENLNVSSSIKAYLSTAVKYKAIDYIRAQKLTFEEKPSNAMEQSIQFDKTEFKELKDVVHQTVNKLPEKCRLVFSMSRFEQMSHGEIAKELGISKKTIENQITKALKILRQSILQYQLD